VHRDIKLESTVPPFLPRSVSQCDMSTDSCRCSSKYPSCFSPVTQEPTSAPVSHRDTYRSWTFAPYPCSSGVSFINYSLR
jgi:hypothetical protein